MSCRNDNALVFSTFDQAIAANPDAKPLFHSDRGFQYTSSVFQCKLAERGMTQSRSRVGYCIDNGSTEGFWGIVKAEMYPGAVSKHILQIENGMGTDQSGWVSMPFLMDYTVKLENPY